ncbi:MAG: ABC transporter permease [Clostridia bacterium]|nr:ABC transporter permease [Clostridia bacterium]
MNSFEKNTFQKRLGSMLKVDYRRMLRSRVFYILIACALVMPILMTVMMSMMDGSISTNPQTGEETVMHGPENTWQNLGTLPGGEAMGGNDVFMMCNINMMFMAVAVFVCLFISDDFRSGYAKNLFTVRAKKGDYVISKTVAGFVCGAWMLIAYFVGSVLGGAVSVLSFDLYGLNVGNLVMCMIAKILLMLVFVSIFVLISVSAKQKAWLSICGSLGGGILLFMTVSMITPLSSTAVNVLLCAAGGLTFAFGLGVISNAILKRTSLV